MRLFVKWLVCCGALLLAWAAFPARIDFSGSWGAMLGMGTVLWLLNIWIRPVAQVVSILITIVTLGLFSLIVNAAMVCLADLVIPAIHIRSFWICIFIALVISVGNAVLLPKRGKNTGDS